MADQPILPTELLTVAARCAEQLVARGETVAVAENTTGGLISAALLAQPGSSRFCRGGAVVYTRYALDGLLAGRIDRPDDLRGATEPLALHLAHAARAHMDADWGIGETGTAGPSPSPDGDPPGHGWVAVAGPNQQTAEHRTAMDDRAGNMAAFAKAALELLATTLAHS